MKTTSSSKHGSIKNNRETHQCIDSTGTLHRSHKPEQAIWQEKTILEWKTIHTKMQFAAFWELTFYLQNHQFSRTFFRYKINRQWMNQYFIQNYFHNGWLWFYNHEPRNILKTWFYISYMLEITVNSESSRNSSSFWDSQSN